MRLFVTGLVCAFLFMLEGSIFAQGEVEEVRRLFNALVSPEPRTNFSITASMYDKRYPKYPLSPADVAAHIEKETRRLQAEGLLSGIGEAAARKQMALSMNKYVSNVSTGVVTEFYYPPAFRLDWKIFRGTNGNTAFPEPDRDFGYIVLDQNAVSAIPVIEVSYAGRSLVKSRVSSISTRPVLKGCLVPNVNCATMIAVMLINTNMHPREIRPFRPSILC